MHHSLIETNVPSTDAYSAYTVHQMQRNWQHLRTDNNEQSVTQTSLAPMHLSSETLSTFAELYFILTVIIGSVRETLVNFCMLMLSSGVLCLGLNYDKCSG